MDMLLVALSITCLVSQILAYNVGQYVIGKIASNPSKYYNLSLLIIWDEIDWLLIGLLVFFFNIRILRLFRFSRRLSLFIDVLSNIAKDGPNFGIFFMIVLTSFAQAFYLMLFSRVYSYSSIPRSIENLFTLLLGNLNGNLQFSFSCSIFSNFSFLNFPIFFSYYSINILKKFNSLCHVR